MQRGSIYWFLYECIIDKWRGNIHLVKGESSVELDSGKVSAELSTSCTTMWEWTRVKQLFDTAMNSKSTFNFVLKN